MSRFSLTIFVLFFVLLLGYAAYHFWPRKVTVGNITNYPSQGTDIIAFGDSLVNGYGADPGHDFVSLLSASINQPIVNLGKDGDTTARALARLNELDKYNPKVVILLVGGNDYLERKDMKVAFQNLGQIIEALQKRGAVVVLVGVRVNYYVGNFDSSYEQLVKQYGVAYVPDVMDGVLGNPKLMFDNIHPNNMGYQIVADRILPVLQQVIK